MLVAAPALLAGCHGVQAPLAAVADQSRSIASLWNVLVGICTAMYVLTMVAVAYSVVRRRRAQREGLTADPVLTRGLIAWTVLIVGLLTWMVAESFTTDRRIRDGHGDVQVRITSKQWWWQVDYLDPDPSKRFTTANELHLPRDRTVHVELISGDVIHSFWVPSLSGKHDLIPGRTNALLLTPRVNGYYRGQCAEFCGLQHAHMAMDVQVEDIQAFDAWRDHQLAPAPAPANPIAARGAELFTSAACVLCHHIGGTESGGAVGPDLTHVASRRSIASGTLPMNRANLTAWIADPQHAKPGSHMPAVPLKPDELTAIVEYLMELK